MDGKQITPSDAKGLWDAANSGYTANGKAGHTLLASYQGALRDSLRGELESVAPGFEEGTQQIAEGLTKNKVLQAVKTTTQKADIINSMKSPIQKILGNSAVKYGASVAGAAELLRMLQGTPASTSTEGQ